MNSLLKILILDGSMRGYITLLGCVMQKRVFSHIITDNTANSSLSHQLNKWLSSKKQTQVTPSQNNIESTLIALTSLPKSELVKAIEITKSSNATLLEVMGEQIKTTNLTKKWGWTDEVLNAVLKLSDIPTTTKKLMQLH